MMDRDASSRAPGPSARPPTPWSALFRDRHVLLAIGAALLIGAFVVAQPRLRIGAGGDLAASDFSLPGLDGLRRGSGASVPGFSRRDLLGRVSVVNVWASWCPSCRDEHDTLLELGRSRKVRLLGIAYHDESAQSRAYLQEHGVPYEAVGSDPSGAVVGRLGVRGIPTTFVIDRNGREVARLVGGLSPERIQAELMPAVEKAWAVKDETRG